MHKIKYWIEAFRLRTLPLSFASIITGNALAFRNYPEYFNAEVLVWCLITTLLLQILSNLANDLGDTLKGADNEFRVGPKRVVQRGLLSLSDMKWGIAVCAFLSLFSGLKLLFESFENEITEAFFFLFLIGIGAICAAITYTLGKNSYGYKGLGDFFVFIFFGWIGVGGSYYLQAKMISPIVMLPATSIGLLAGSVLHLNNMRDSDGDIKAGKITLAVRLGTRYAKYYYYGLIIVAIGTLVSYLMLTSVAVPRMVVAMLPSVIFLYTTYKVSEITLAASYDSLLKYNALGAFALSVCIAIALNL